MRKTILLGVATLCSVALIGVATAPTALAKNGVTPAGPATATVQKAHKVKHGKIKNTDPVIYDSTVQPNPGNLASQSFEAGAVAEFGNQITFGGSARVLDNVVVQMSSWNCGTSGGWTGTFIPLTDPCVTARGATFTEPITLNIYSVGPANAYGPSTVGRLIASDTQTFAVPYRPSADPNYTTDCLAEATADSIPVEDFDGTWYDASLNKCFNGYLTSITFTLGHVVLPNSVIYGIAYNTSDWGAQPYGDNAPCHSTSEGCGYNGLNVATSEEPTSPSVGSDTYPGTVYWDVVASDYAVNEVCDAPGLAAGLNVFRIDEPANYPTGNGTTSGCWSVNNSSWPPTVTTPPWSVPAVQFNAVQSEAATITSADSASVVAGTPFSFSVTTTGVPVPHITEMGRLPHGLTFTANGNGTATIGGRALTSNRNKAYNVTLRATNLPTGGRNRQRFTLTLTGGRS